MRRRWVFAGPFVGLLLVVVSSLGFAQKAGPSSESSITWAILPSYSSMHGETCQRVPVLLYHDVQPGAQGENGAVISAEEFAAQMAWLHQNGFHTITTADLLGWLQERQELPDKPILITFDDGYRSVYTQAYPILKRYGLKATIFMVTSYAGQQIGDLTYLSWDEMKEMKGSGLVEIQAHSHNGHYLVGKEPALLTWSAAKVQSDLRELNEAMQQAGLPAARAYAYPYGAYNPEVQEALKESNIELAFTTEFGGVTAAHGDPFALPRVPIFPGTEIDQFANLVTGDGDASCRTGDRAVDHPDPLRGAKPSAQ